MDDTFLCGIRYSTGCDKGHILGFIISRACRFFVISCGRRYSCLCRNLALLVFSAGGATVRNAGNVTAMFVVPYCLCGQYASQ